MGHSHLPGGRHDARVAPLTISLANSVRCCIRAGKSLQALHRHGDGQRNQGQLSCSQQPGTPLLDALFRSDITGQGWASRRTQMGNSLAHLRVGRGVCVGGISPQVPLSKGRATPQKEQLGLVCVLMTCRTHANTGHRHAGTAMGSKGENSAPQAHAADIYNAITASAEAVQSATGCKNSLQENKRVSRSEAGKRAREGCMGGCRRRHRHRRCELGTRGGA